MIKRRSAIEPTIGRMKSEGKLGRNCLKGASGDALRVIPCGAGRNITSVAAPPAVFLRPDTDTAIRQRCRATVPGTVVIALPASKNDSFRADSVHDECWARYLIRYSFNSER